MIGIVKRIMQLGLIWLICFCLFDRQSAWAESNISNTYKYAWSENAGWQNWRATNAQARVGWTYLVGYVWAENIGWIKLGSTPSGGTYPNTTSTNWGVNHNSATGALSGYGWSENVGWINFNPTHSQVIIDTATLKFDGYAWAENVGYIHFQNAIPEYYVQQTNPRTLLAHGNASSLDSSVKKVEMFDGISWITLFTGAAQLNMVPGGTFPGISNNRLPVGTYSRIRVTFHNSFPVTGTLNYGGTSYYTTAKTFGGQTHLESTPTTVAGDMAVFTFYEPTWGAFDADVTRTDSVTPVTVNSATNYQPTLLFHISDALELHGTPGTPSTYYFKLHTPWVRIVAP